MDYGWDTSEDEGGMEIDLDAQQEEQRELNHGKSETGMECAVLILVSETFYFEGS